jgi:hypothetical protein
MRPKIVLVKAPAAIAPRYVAHRRKPLANMAPNADTSAERYQ